MVSVDQYCHVLCMCKCDSGGLLNLMKCTEGDKKDRKKGKEDSTHSDGVCGEV